MVDPRMPARSSSPPGLGDESFEVERSVMDPASGFPCLGGDVSLTDLLACFPLQGGRTDDDCFDEIAREELCTPYDQLLDHEHHMTVTLEEFFGRPVVLHARRIRHEGDVYARELTLTAGTDGPIVMAGIMRLRLEYVPPAVRDAILTARTPLGRILIEHGVLRRIRLHTLFRVRRGPRFPEMWAQSPTIESTFGRAARIWCDERPAVELLEIVSPAASAFLR